MLPENPQIRQQMLKEEHGQIRQANRKVLQLPVEQLYYKEHPA